MAEIYVPGAIDIMGSANQMMQFRNTQQAQQENAMRMQYAMEDRARAEQARKMAEGNALAERARKQQLIDIVKGGYTPAKMAGMGPGTIQGNTPASFDAEQVKNELLRRGDLSGLSTFSNVQEQLAKQQEAEAKATGQGLANVKTSAETTGVNAENVKKFIDLQRMQIDAAPDIQTIKAITAASYAPGHPLTAFHEQNGVTLEQALAGIDSLAAQGKSVDEIRAQMAQGASVAAKNFADVAKVKAETTQVGKPTPTTVPSGYRVKPNGDLEPIPGGPADPKIANKATPAPVGYRYKADGSGDLEAIPGGPEASKTIGATAKAEDTIATAEDSIKKINDLVKHPGLSEAVGFGFGTRLLPGTSASDFQARLEEIKGGAFLKAYESLRGTGSISEIEGAKATQAITRMGLSQSEEEFKRAAEEYKAIIERGMEKEKARLQKTSGKSENAPKIARSVDIEHTAKQNNMSVEDTKARLRSMGYKIEGE